MDVGTAELFSRVGDEAKRLLREELRFTRAELKAEAKHAARGAAIASAGGMITHLGAMTAAATVVLVLAMFMAAWLAALITSVALAAVGYVLVRKGSKQLQEARPTELLRSFEEDKRWASETMHAMKSSRRANA